MRRLPLAGAGGASKATDPLRFPGRSIAIAGVGERELAAVLVQALGELGVEVAVVTRASEAGSAVTIVVGVELFEAALCDFRIAIGEPMNLADEMMIRRADLWLAEPRPAVVRALAPALAGAL